MTLLSKENFKSLVKVLDAEPYEMGDNYCFKINDEVYRLSLVQDLGGYVVEYAESEKDADNNLFEDLDIIPNDCSAKELINSIVNYIKNN